MLDVLMVTPYIAIAASLLLVGTVTAVCMQFAKLPKVSGFGSRDRRRVSYRGAVKTARGSQLQEAA